MFSTQYSLAQSFANIGSGRNDRFIYSDIANKFSDLSEQVGYLSVKARGAKGNGNNVVNRNDDSNAILDAITEATLSGRGIEFPAGVYYITKNTTIFDCKFYKGAILLPANNTVTISFAGHIDAGIYKIFDFSLGGKVDLSRATIKFSEARWFGLIGDAITDDTPNLNNLCNNIPQFHVVHFDQFLQVALYSTWVIFQKQNIGFVQGNRAPGSAYFGTQIASFTWKGPAGGRMINFQDSSGCELRGFNIDSQNAGVSIDLDQTIGHNPNYICSNNKVKENNFIGGFANRGIVHVRIGNVSPDNCEYMHIEENRFAGNGYIGLCKFYNGGIYGANGTSTVTCTAGNINITFGSPILASYIGTSIRFRCNGIGNGGKGKLLDCTLTVITSTTGTLSVAPIVSLVAQSPYFILDDNCGIGVQIGAHQNAKRQLSVKNHYTNLKYGLDVLGGSFHCFEDNFPDNDINIFVEGSAISEQCSDHRSNTEQCRIHLAVLNNVSYICEQLRSAYMPNPGAGMIILLQGSTSELRLTQFNADNNVNFVDTGASYFDFHAASGCTIRLDAAAVQASCTLQDVGLDEPSLGNLTLIYGTGLTQSGNLAFPNATQEFYHYDPNIGFHDVRYTVQRTSYILFFPDLNQGPSDILNLTNRLLNYSGSFWVDYSGPSSILRIEEKTGAGVLNTRYIYNTLRGNKIYDPPNLAALASTTTTITIAGAALGDKVKITFSLDRQGIVFDGYVSSSNTVTAILFNPTGGAIDLASGTLSATVEKS